MITTKKGSTDGTVRVTYTQDISTLRFQALLKYSLPTEEEATTQYGVLQTDFITSSWGAVNDGTVYDNVKDFFQGGSIWDNSFSISGGHKNGSFYMSASRYDQTGVVPGTGYDKTTFRFNGEQKYGRLTIGANVAYSVANTDTLR